MDSKEMTKDKGVEEVIAALNWRFFRSLRPGTQEELGKHLGVSKQAVNQWKRVPAEHVLAISELLNLEPSKLRPDIFGSKRVRSLMRNKKNGKG